MNCKYFISHRGNITGRQEKDENSPKYIRKALSKGYDVEIDVWYHEKEFWLGHDKPEHKVSKKFLTNNKLWCHAKNSEALKKMCEENINCFWHQDDDYTLTLNKLVWAYPGNANFYNCIDVMPEMHTSDITKYKPKSLGVCSDFIGIIKENYLKK